MLFVLMQAMLSAFREAFYAQWFFMNAQWFLDMIIFLLLKISKRFIKDFKRILYQGLRFP